MKIVINNNGKRIPATLEVVDGVMIVSPIEDKVDISQFKDGDIITYNYGINCISTVVLKGEVDTIGECFSIEDYCGISSIEGLWIVGDYSDTATYIRYATEEEKQKLFDALAKDGKTWDAERKAVVDLKWEPYIGEIYYSPLFYHYDYLFKSYDYTWRDLFFDEYVYNKGWCFKTKEECEAYCERLNQAIMEVKP